MNNTLTIKNFRIFDETGASIDLAPITILTGCNSSGKSTFVKAFILLNKLLSKISEDFQSKSFSDINLSNYTLDFRDTNLLLNSFENVLNSNSKNGIITFEYTTHSSVIADDVTVELKFKSDNSAIVQRGCLSCITIKNKNGDIIYSTDEQLGLTVNSMIIKEKFFLFAESLWYYQANSHYEDEYNMSINETDKKTFEKECEFWENSLAEQDRSVINDFFEYFSNNIKNIIYEWKNVFDAKHSNDRTFTNIISKSKDLKLLFYLPILEELNTIPKDKVKGAVKQRIKTDYDKPDQALLIQLSDILFTNFEESEFSSFLEYFQDAENEFINISNMPKSFLLKSCDSSPRFVLGSDFSIEEIVEIEEMSQDPKNFPNPNEITPNTIQFKEKDILAFTSRNLARKGNFQYRMFILLKLNDIYDSNTKNYCSIGSYDFPEVFTFNTTTLFAKYINSLVREVLTCELSHTTYYAKSSRSVVRRSYFLDDDDPGDMVRLIIRYLNSKKALKEQAKNTANIYEPDSFMTTWLHKFNLGNTFTIELNDDASVARLKLYKSNDDKRGELIADKGYGITQLFTILLQIETAILNAEKTHDGGYKPQYIAIEEPEIHLHPSFQSKLADMFLEAYEKYNIHFIVETHSEYLIRESQVIIAKKQYVSNIESDTKSPFRTYYLPENHQPYSLGYRKDGRFYMKFGKGFFDESSILSITLNQLFFSNNNKN